MKVWLINMWKLTGKVEDRTEPINEDFFNKFKKSKIDYRDIASNEVKKYFTYIKKSVKSYTTSKAYVVGIDELNNRIDKSNVYITVLTWNFDGLNKNDPVRKNLNKIAKDIKNIIPNNYKVNILYGDDDNGQIEICIPINQLNINESITTNQPLNEGLLIKYIEHKQKQNKEKVKQNKNKSKDEKQELVERAVELFKDHENDFKKYINQCLNELSPKFKKSFIYNAQPNKAEYVPEYTSGNMIGFPIFIYNANKGYDINNMTQEDEQEWEQNIRRMKDSIGEFSDKEFKKQRAVAWDAQFGIPVERMFNFEEYLLIMLK